MEKIKKLLEDGLFALELDQDRPHTLFEFATIKYDDGCLYIDGEIVENALNEESIDNKLILKSKRSCIEIHSNSIIYQTSDDEEKEYVFGDHPQFYDAYTTLCRILSNIPSELRIDEKIVRVQLATDSITIDGKRIGDYLRLLSLASRPQIQYKSVLLLKCDEEWRGSLY